MALSRREGLLIAGTAAIIAGMVVYLRVHQPLFRALTEARTAIEDTQRTLARDRSAVKREGDLADRELKLEAHKRELTSRVPGRHSATLLVYHLAQAERDSGVVVRSIGVRTDKGPASLQAVKLTLKVEGTFISHILFSQAVEGAPVFLADDALTLNRASDLPASSQPAACDCSGSPPTATAQYDLTLYLRPEDKGPDTDSLTYATTTGRDDPFANVPVSALTSGLGQAFPGAPIAPQPPPGVRPNDRHDAAVPKAPQMG